MYYIQKLACSQSFTIDERISTPQKSNFSIIFWKKEEKKKSKHQLNYLTKP